MGTEGQAGEPQPESPLASNEAIEELAARRAAHTAEAKAEEHRRMEVLEDMAAKQEAHWMRQHGKNSVDQPDQPDADHNETAAA